MAAEFARVRRAANGVGIEGRFYVSAEHLVARLERQWLEVLGWALGFGVVCLLVGIGLGFVLGVQAELEMLR